MDLRSAPALLPATALLAASLAAWRSICAPVPLAVALLGCGMAAGGIPGRVTTAGAAGLLAVWARGEGGAASARPPARHRPVTLTGRRIGPWRSRDAGWRAPLRAARYRQGRRVVPWSERVHVTVLGPRPPGARRLSVRGYVRRASGLANDPQLTPGPWSLRVKSSVFFAARDGPLAGALSRVVEAMRREVDRALGSEPRGGDGKRLARALVLGDSTALPPAWRRGLRRAGLAHLTALSGLHVGLLAAFALTAACRLPRGLRLLPAAGAVGLYLILAGPRPGLVRATGMLLLAGGALALGRPPRPANLLACTAGLIGLGEAGIGQDLGFRLSAAATAGLVLLAPRLAAAWSGLPTGLAKPLAATTAAQLASLPVALPAFHLLAPLAPLWNLAAIPWTGLTLVAGFGWTALAVAAPAAAAPLVPVLDLLAAPFAALSAMPPALFLPLPLVVGPAAGAGLAAALAFVLCRPRLLAPGAALVLAIWPSVLPAGRQDAPAAAGLHVLDVGQGEALLLTDGPAALLLDGGGWRYGGLGDRVLLPALARAGVGRLSALALTHPDLDHCGGLVEIAAYLPVEEVWTAPGWRASPCVDRLLSLPAVRLRPLWRGETVRLGGWHFEALHPPAGDRYRGGRRSGNDRSLVLMARWGETRLLLTGDLEAAGERRLLAAAGDALAADVLKVAHHGSRTSTTSELLAAVRPRLALISAGVGNTYGHPAPEVLRRLAAAGVPVLSTHRTGMIRLRLRPRAGPRIDLAPPRG